jgi:hypothetical protein
VISAALEVASILVLKTVQNYYSARFDHNSARQKARLTAALTAEQCTHYKLTAIGAFVGTGVGLAGAFVGATVFDGFTGATVAVELSLPA